MCRFACNGWGSLDGACVHAWQAKEHLRVGMHVVASEPPARTLLALHFPSLAL
jgi:hypothetical protein